MNIVFLIVDSLRAQSLSRARTPFLHTFSEHGIWFERAYATECWTLPTHMSMFTGLLPSEHGAHFQGMGYRSRAPTIAERLADAGFHTEIMTRCPIFEGSVPGVLRGFKEQSRPMATPGFWNPTALLISLTKPRLKRQLRETGFFHPDQRANATFLARYIQSLFPADEILLDRALERMRSYQERREPYFLFANLFDVHAPYCPTRDAMLAPAPNLEAWIDNFVGLDALAKIGRHQYLEEGFAMSARGQRVLLDRYHRAVALEDAKLAAFYEEASAAGLLDDTLLVIAADHGEAFGEHDLYCHDASLYDTNIHVPLWVHHPRLGGGRVRDVVSMRAIFDLLLHAGVEDSFRETIVSERVRQRDPVAIAEHFRYPHLENIQPRYRFNQVAAIGRDTKFVVRGGFGERVDLKRDPSELAPVQIPIDSGMDRDFLQHSVGAIAASHMRAFCERHVPKTANPVDG